MAVGFQFHDVHLVAESVQTPQAALGIETDTLKDDIVLVIGDGGLQRTVVNVVVLYEAGVLKFIQSSASCCKQVLRIQRVYGHRVQILVGVTGKLLDVLRIAGPVFLFVHALQGGGAQQVLHHGVATTAAVELLVNDLHEAKVVVVWTVGPQAVDGGEVVVPVAVVLLEKLIVNASNPLPVMIVNEVVAHLAGQHVSAFRLGIDGTLAHSHLTDVLAKHIGLSNLCPLHVYLHHAKARGQIGVDVVRSRAVHGLVLRHRLGIEGADVGDVTLDVHHVDVGVVIDDDEACGGTVPGNEVNARVVQRIHLVESGNALIIQVILVQVVRSPDKQRIARFHYLLWLVIGHVSPPCSRLCQ